MWRRESTKKEKFKKRVYCWKEKEKNDSQKKDETFQSEVFFFFQKSWKDNKKSRRCERRQKKTQTTIATRRKDKEQDKCAPKRRRKTQQREQSEKWRKRRWKETKREKSKRKTQTGERTKKRKEEKRMKKGIHKKRCLKRKREKSFKNVKKQEWKHFFEKREETFLLTKRVQLKIKAEKTFLVFSKKKKRGKVDPKNTFYKEKFKKNTFFLFSFWWNFFFDKKTKEEKQNSWWTCENWLKKRESSKNMSCFSWRQTFFLQKDSYKRKWLINIHKGISQNIDKGRYRKWEQEKKAKKEKRRKTRFAKGTKERKQRDNQKYAPKKENSDEKRREEKTSNKKMVHTENNEKKDKYFGWISVGQVARNVEHCLWPPTCSSWQFACCGFQRAQLLSPNLFEFVELAFSCWVAYFEPAFLGACSLELVNVWKSVVCRGNKIVFVCLLRWLHDLFVCTSPASCLALTIQLVQFSVRFLLLRLCVFLSSWIYVPISLLAVSLLVCEALATLVYFSGAVGDTWRSRHCRYVHLRVFRFAPRVALACSVSFPSPCLFLLHRLRCLLLGQGRCSLGRPWWILAWFLFSSVVAVCWMLLLTSRCGQGFFPVARSSDPDIVPCTDGDDGASCAEAGWRDIRLWYLFQCCRFQRPCAWSLFRFVPLLSPAVAGVGATSVLLRNVAALFTAYSAHLWRRESFSLLVDWDDQQLLNSCLHLSRPRTVIFWYGSSRCQQLLLSAWLEVVVICAFLDLLCEFSRLLCVIVWRGILSWLLFAWCCGCLAAGHLACRNDVAPSSVSFYLWFLSACVFVTWSWVSDLLVVPK